MPLPLLRPIFSKSKSKKACNAFNFHGGLDLILKSISYCPCNLPEQGEPLYAIADLHGDYSKATRALRVPGLLDEDGYWAGGKATVVQLGDLMDRGPYSLDCINLFERLKVFLLQQSTFSGAVLSGHHPDIWHSTNQWSPLTRLACMTVLRHTSLLATEQPTISK